MTAGIKISGLPVIASPALSDTFPVVQSGVTYEESCTQLQTLLTGTGSFILKTPLADQHITAYDLFVDDGFIISGSPTGGINGAIAMYPITGSKGSLQFVADNNTGNFGVTITNAAFGQASTITIPDPGAASANFLLDSSSTGTSTTSATASATPGTIRAFKGLITSSNTTVTTGNLVGLRGEVDYVGASGGFFYGVQGKLIPTGTLSGSSWSAALFGQLDWHAATINAGQVACVWADMGATSGTATDVTGLRMFAGTNTTAATANSMIYLYGKTSNLLELDANGSTYISAGGATASGTIKKIAILIEGVQYYLQAATVYS